MMKHLITVFFLSCFVPAVAQSLTVYDLGTLLPYLKNEDWQAAYTSSTALLEKHGPEDTSSLRAAVVYMNLYAAAGMVIDNKMSYDELGQKVKKMEGQHIRMPGHPVTIKDGGFNQVKFTVTDTSNTAFTATANAKGINILCFEHFNVKEKINLEDFPPGSFAGFEGTVRKIEINPRRSGIWVLKITVDDAIIRKAN